MTSENYENMMEKLMDVFDGLYDMEVSDPNANTITKRANAMVAVTKVCLQTEIVRRTYNRTRNRLEQNLPSLVEGTVDNVEVNLEEA